MKTDYNFTEIYNQIRGIRDVVVVKVIDTDKLDAASDEYNKYTLLEMKFISEGDAVKTIKVKPTGDKKADAKSAAMCSGGKAMKNASTIPRSGAKAEMPSKIPECLSCL